MMNDQRVFGEAPEGQDLSTEVALLQKNGGDRIGMILNTIVSR